MHGGGDALGGCAWQGGVCNQGAYMAYVFGGHAWQGRHVWQGGMHGGGAWRGAWVVGAWVEGACMAGGMHGRGHAWKRGMYGRGACMAGGMLGGKCVVGKMAIAVGGAHPTGMYSCLFHLVMWIQQS